MIIGVGVDLIDIRRIASVIDRYGARFSHRIFTELERRHCERRRQPVNGFAMRYAAKEACAKALGTGFRQGVYWRDIEVYPLPSGKPTLRLYGQAAAHLRRLTPSTLVPSIDVSLTDEYPYGQAFVVISAIVASSNSESF
ncbi:MAG: holo-ACP synthase [Rhodospirillales bacterium]|nr:holo-ACP synthase [Rhodospirillales bacterium]